MFRNKHHQNRGALIRVTQVQEQYLNMFERLAKCAASPVSSPTSRSSPAHLGSALHNTRSPSPSDELARSPSLFANAGSTRFAAWTSPAQFVPGVVTTGNQASSPSSPITVQRPASPAYTHDEYDSDKDSDDGWPEQARFASWSCTQSRPSSPSSPTMVQHPASPAYTHDGYDSDRDSDDGRPERAVLDQSISRARSLPRMLDELPQCSMPPVQPKPVTASPAPQRPTGLVYRKQKAVAEKLLTRIEFELAKNQSRLEDFTGFEFYIQVPELRSLYNQNLSRLRRFADEYRREHGFQLNADVEPADLIYKCTAGQSDKVISNVANVGFGPEYIIPLVNASGHIRWNDRANHRQAEDTIPSNS